MRIVPVKMKYFIRQGDSIYFLWSKKNLWVKSCLEHRFFLASTVVSARYRAGTKGQETRYGGLKIKVKVNTPSDPAESRRRPTFLKEEGKKIKTSSAQGLCPLAAGLVFGSLARGLRPQACGGVETSINSTGTLVFSDMRSNTAGLKSRSRSTLLPTRRKTAAGPPSSKGKAKR